MTIQDEPGAKPRDLNPEEIFEPQRRLNPAERAKLNSIDDEVVAEVDGYSRPSAPRELASPPRPMTTGTGREVVGAAFDPRQTVPTYLQGTFNQLSIIQKFLHNKDVQHIQRNQVLKLTKELFNYQYQDMQHLLTLGMDVQKKDRFLQYLNATKNMQDRLQRESSDSQLAVIDTYFENRLDAQKAKANRIIEFEKLYKKGDLDQNQYEQFLRDNESETEQHIERIHATMKLMIARHGEFLNATLELFKTKLLREGWI